MPPKATGPRAAQDWSWAGTEVTSADSINLAHRRRAAGLAGPLAPRACVYQYNDPGRVQSVDSDGEYGAAESSARKCQPKRCKTNPRCYNYIGGKEWIEDGARDKFIDINVDDEVTLRDGPAGLQNLGATCYANAFLQVRFYDVAFRNAVYGAIGPHVNALYHLGSVFGMLQHSRRAVVDPGALINALKLNKGEQQDAAEFSKLFMTLLTEQFQSTDARNFMRDQYEGIEENKTTCNTCGYESKRDSSFLEIGINLQDKSSLQERLADKCKPEYLIGDNMYRCPQCDSLQPAIRTTTLKKLPPVLHFELMRFEYDPKSYSRKKSKKAITYPRELTLNGDQYELRAVVIHLGTSATHGHFVCEVFNEADKQWYLCSDGEITKMDDRPKKRAKSESGDESQPKDKFSRDAYMLVYKRKTVADVEVRSPPLKIMEAIEADNTVVEAEITSRDSTKATLGDEFDHLTAIKKEVLRLLPGTDCIVPTEALTTWLKSRDPKTEWDFSTLTCQHGNVSVDAAPSLKLISRAAFNELSNYAELTEMDICDTCVKEGFASRVEQASHAEKVATFDEFNNGSNGYVLPKAWLKEWRAGRLPPDTPPTADKYTLFCEHGNPAVSPKNARECISGDGLVYLKSIFGDFDAFATDAEACELCMEGAQASEQERSTWASTVKPEKQLQKQLDQFQVIGSTHYLLPATFAAKWTEYLKRPGARPELEMEFCPHHGLDFDPQLDKATYISEAGWHSLCRLYNHNPSDCVSVISQAGPTKGKKYPITDISVETCVECRDAKLSNFDEMWLTIVKEDGDSKGKGRTTRRNNSKNGPWQIEVKKDTTVSYIRKELFEEAGEAVIGYRLTFRGRVVESSETVGGMGITVKDILKLEPDPDAKDDREVIDLRDEDEGFGGTALVGRINCKHCTFSNDPGSEMCQICGLPVC